MTTICNKCYKPCYTKMMDFGYGRYEYFGAVGFHVSMEEVSECCEWDVTEKEEEDDSEESTSKEAS